MQTEDLARYANDVVAFAEEQFMVPGPHGPELIRLQPHQKRILRHCLTPGEDGRFPYETILYSCPKKSGKSTIAAIVGLWCALRERMSETYALANDQEQAQGRVFAALRYAVDHNPGLRRSAKVQPYRITFPTTGSYIEAVPSNYRGQAGSNPSCTLWDELWGYVRESAMRLWDELTPPPTRHSPIRFISSYAGFEGESELLWELYRQGITGGLADPSLELPCYRDGRLFCYWDHEPRMPWQTPEYYEAQRASLRPNAYLRMHENRWVSGTESFIDLALWDACIDQGARPMLPDPKLEIVAGVDASVKHDSSAVVAVAYDREAKRVLLVAHRVWQPSRRQPLDLDATIGDYLRELHRGYRLRTCYYDPYQMHAVATQLTRDGLKMVEYPQSSGNLTRMGQNLLDLLKGRNLAMYSDQAMRRAASQAVAVEGSRGWRIAKEKSAHRIDVIVALGMAAQAAVEVLAAKLGVASYMPSPYSDNFTEAMEAVRAGTWYPGWSGRLSKRELRAAKHTDPATPAHVKWAKRHLCPACAAAWEASEEAQSLESDPYHQVIHH